MKWPGRRLRRKPRQPLHRAFVDQQSVRRARAAALRPEPRGRAYNARIAAISRGSATSRPRATATLSVRRQGQPPLRDDEAGRLRRQLRGGRRDVTPLGHAFREAVWLTSRRELVCIDSAPIETAVAFVAAPVIRARAHDLGRPRVRVARRQVSRRSSTRASASAKPARRRVGIDRLSGTDSPCQTPSDDVRANRRCRSGHRGRRCRAIAS